MYWNEQKCQNTTSMMKLSAGYGFWISLLIKIKSLHCQPFCWFQQFIIYTYTFSSKFLFNYNLSVTFKIHRLPPITCTNLGIKQQSWVAFVSPNLTRNICFCFLKSFGILPFVHCTHSTSHNQNPGQETLHFLHRLSQNLSLLLVKRNIKNNINKLSKLTCHLQHYVGPRVIVNCPRSIVYSFEASDWCWSRILFSDWLIIDRVRGIAPVVHCVGGSASTQAGIIWLPHCATKLPDLYYLTLITLILKSGSMKLLLLSK